MSSPSTNSSTKPNVYVTYTYDVGVAVEGTVGKIVGILRQGAFIWVLDANGKLFQYNQSDFSYVTQIDVSAVITGTKANAGLYFDSANINILTATGVSASESVKRIPCGTTGTPGTPVTYTGLAINGSTAVIRGGHYDGASQWMVINGVAQAFSNAGNSYTPNRGLRRGGGAIRVDCARGTRQFGVVGWLVGGP